MSRYLEIACFDVKSGIIAAEAGADRIEFCRNYAIGGKSPSLTDFIELRQRVTLPIYVMIRPRSGSFIYSETEVSIMCDLISQFKNAGADGFVFGCLTNQRTIDVAACEKLISKTGGLPCTFHRAIDEVNDLDKSLVQLVDLGFTSVLTSGKNCNATLGRDTLAKMQETHGANISIIVGGGVRTTTVKNLLSTGCSYFHSAAIDENTMQADKNEIITLKNTLLTHEAA